MTYGQETMSIQKVARHVRDMLDTKQRIMLGIAGPPAGGKSTYADTMHAIFEDQGIPSIVVPMDGFHLDNKLLDELGLRKRKGAPETFDADGFTALLRRLRQCTDPVYLPVFDRDRDLSVASARAVSPGTRVVIVEGNYLLFDEEPWRQLADLWDLSIWIDTPEEVVLERCVQRWLDHGHLPSAARTRAEGNDLVNARRIVGARLPSDVVFTERANVSGDL